MDETQDGKQVPAKSSEDTASSSSQGREPDDESGEASDGESSMDEYDQPMPLLSYTRLFGSLPRRPATSDSNEAQPTEERPFAVPSTCSVMAQVYLSKQDSTSNAGNTPNISSPNPDTTNDLARTPETARRGSPQSQYFVPYGDPLLTQQAHYVMALGYSNGSIDLVDPRTGVAVVPSQQLKLRQNAQHRPESVVDLSMDSTGSFLAAIDSGLMAVIWEFRYTIALQSASSNNGNNDGTQGAVQQQQPAPATPDGGMFSNFMSALTLGGSPQPTAPQSAMAAESSTPEATTDDEIDGGGMVPRLAISSIQLSRITYPKSFGVPTCIAIDPTYSKRRDKAVLVGFLDGRLVLTKRGLIFQRRTDAIIYQGTYNENSHHRQGIEAIEWRGSLAAWADASGIRLFDTDTLTRIAHIDRPTGARATLYPTLSSLKPTLRFETQNYLLVAWGDCLMGLSITDNDRKSNEESPSTQQSQQQPVVRRRTVECAMAWELDCVASGVVPLDSEHVLVLGLVPPCDDENESSSERPEQRENDLELQIVAKGDGSIIFSNILPLIREASQRSPTSPRNQATQSVITESAADYSLLSTFALSRMEDTLEAEMMAEEEPMMEDAFDLQVSLFSPTSQPQRKYVDPHLKYRVNFDNMTENEDLHTEDDNDGNSVDSDDYGFIFRRLSTIDENVNNERQAAAPPLMVIASTSDAVLACMRDVDDAVSYALESGKSALALQRGLRGRRRLRKFNSNYLVDEYFTSLLKIPKQESDDISDKPRKSLSLRRLKLAAKAMPVLFGGEVALWQRWLAAVEIIPGAVFVVSDCIPVRDPKLPEEVYERVLATMLKEIYEMKEQDDAQDTISKAEQVFLSSLTGWGPTTFLQEHIRHCKLDATADSAVDAIQDAERRFARRFTQSSAGYLSFPVSNEDSVDAVGIQSEGYFESKRALFDIDRVIEMVNLRAPLVAQMNTDTETSVETMREENARVALDAMARLQMMKAQYDTALKCLISIGALYSPRPLSLFKSGAVDFSKAVGSREIDKPCQGTNGVPFTFLLDIIDSHHLQQCFLTDNFLSNSKSKKVVPLLSLLQLVGFTEMGNFLIEHCVPPQLTDKSNADSASPLGEDRRGTLPLDLVADQLDSSPRILHWYLHLVFLRKPEIYVRFPNTAYPPQAVTELHRRHFDLYLDFAGEERDSAAALSGIEAYKVNSVETRLLKFLKVALPLGGIRIQDAKKALEEQRRKDEQEGFSTAFSLELAYILEHYGDESETEAHNILNLYMKGAKSMILAVSFAQRNKSYSTSLWGSLIRHCLDQESAEEKHLDGSLFGSLLEAAALSGADLAHLVTQIPPGMAIEGLRPRLVAAVADYRFKLQMHETASEGASEEMIALLRELSHRSRRGARYQLVTAPKLKVDEGDDDADVCVQEGKHDTNALPKSLRTIVRQDRQRLGVPPIR